MDRTYTYTPLKDVRYDRQKRYYVFGVVSFIKQPTKGRGTDYIQVMSIKDESFEGSKDKLKCLFFTKTLEAAPKAVIGNIIRIHRMKCVEFNKAPQGQSAPGFAWVVFDEHEGAELKALAHSSADFVLDDYTRGRVESLRAWFADCDEVLSQDTSLQPQTGSRTGPRTGPRTLDQIQVNQYFDLVCQVVGRCIAEEGVSVMLKVWDGTKPAISCHEMELASGYEVDPVLERRGRGYLVDVFVYDDHYFNAELLKPGDFLELRNLHALKRKEQHSLVPVVELSLHGGSSYHRGMHVLSPAMRSVQILRERLRDIPELPDSDEEERDTSRKFTDDSLLDLVSLDVAISPGNHAKPHDNQPPSPSNQSVSPGTKRKSEGEGQVPGEKQSRQMLVTGLTNGQTNSNNQPESLTESEPERCMQRTATVLAAHHHIKRSTIRDVYNHKAPHKFRLRARLIDYFPRATSVSNFVTQFCKECQHACKLTDRQVGSKQLGCGDCTQHAEGAVKHIYMLRLLLGDETGWLVANLWKGEAVKFFHDTPPSELVGSDALLDRIHGDLYFLCPDPGLGQSEAGASLWMECCIQSFVSKNNTVTYEMFDTVLAHHEDS